MNKFITMMALLASFCLSAKVKDISDYKKQMTLQLKGNASGYQFDVPDEVYENSLYPDLRDMRIINATGDFVPMRVYFPTDEVLLKYSQTTLPVFKLNKTITKKTDSQQTQTTIDGTYQDYTLTTSKTLSHYLENLEIKDPKQIIIDATILKGQKIESLELDWHYKTQGNRIFTVDLFASNDLSHWNLIKKNQQLIEINTNSRVILKNKLALNQSAYGYYKVIFSQALVPEVLQAKAIQVDQLVKKSQQIKNVAGYAVQNDKTIRLSTGGAYTLDAFILSFNQENVITDVKLYSRDKVKHLRPRGIFEGQGTIYSMTSKGITVKNNTIKIRPSNKRLWQFQFDDNIDVKSVKNIKMKWRRHKVEFLAQGNAPFTLIYKNSNKLMPLSSHWYDKIPEELRKTLFSSNVTLLKSHKFTQKTNNLSINKSTNQENSNYAKWMFWVILSVVLLVLFVMAYKLLNETNKNGASK